jgi:hypothetical protein
MKHNRIVRGLVMILVIALVVLCVILACKPVRAAECRLDGKPQPTPWEPDEADIVALAQTLYGECRGCSELQQRAVCWCIFNRVDDERFPDTIIGVVSQPHQLQGYSSSNPVWDSLYQLANDCLVDWRKGENRVLEPEYCWFYGDGSRNHFTAAWNGGREWCEG